MLPFLSPIKVAQTLGDFGMGDVQTTCGPLWFLTNGLCQSTGYWDARVFQYYGVEYSDKREKELYPLTGEEKQFLLPDGIELPGYVADLRTGYSAWWQSRKWFNRSPKLTH